MKEIKFRVFEGKWIFEIKYSMFLISSLYQGQRILHIQIRLAKFYLCCNKH